MNKLARIEGRLVVLVPTSELCSHGWQSRRQAVWMFTCLICLLESPIHDCLLHGKGNGRYRRGN